MRQLVLQADPDWAYDSRVVPEYEFSASGGSNTPRGSASPFNRGRNSEVDGGFRKYEGDKTVFYGDYQTRGPYDGS